MLLKAAVPHAHRETRRELGELVPPLADDLIGNDDERRLDAPPAQRALPSVCGAEGISFGRFAGVGLRAYQETR